MIKALQEHPKGLSIVLAAIWIVSWLLHGLGEWWQGLYRHGTEPWWLLFFTTTFENWQSEFLQVLALVSLTAVLYHTGSPESKDGDERLEAKVDDLADQVEKMRHQLFERQGWEWVPSDADEGEPPR